LHGTPESVSTVVVLHFFDAYPWLRNRCPGIVVSDKSS
jgi:hypothetical protein